MSSADVGNLGDEVLAWGRLANAGWDYSPSQHWFHREILYPTVVDVLMRAEPERTLDFGCGRGHLAVHLEEVGFPCHAYDPAEGMPTLAHERGLSTFSDLGQLKPRSYDAVVANAVFSTVKEPLPTLRSIRDLLTPGGHLVISIPHPVFTLLDEIHTTTERTWLNPDGEGEREGVWRYLSRPEQAVGWGSDLPETRLFHRTLGDYSEMLSGCGFLISAVIEPVPRAAGAQSNPELHELFTRIPGFLVIDAVA